MCIGSQVVENDSAITPKLVLLFYTHYKFSHRWSHGMFSDTPGTRPASLDVIFAWYSL